MSEKRSMEFHDLVSMANDIKNRDQTLKRHPERMKQWGGSNLEWMIPSISPGTKGKIFKQMAEGYLTHIGFSVRKGVSRDGHDRLVNGRKVAVKGSTLWEDGTYTFEQVRKKGDYEVIIFLGISPSEASCWAIPKSRIFHESGEVAASLGNLVPQHARDNCWIRGTPADLSAELLRYGGSISEEATARKIKRIIEEGA